MSLRPEFDAERNVIAVGDSRLVFHCHHYNMFLQRTLADGLGERALSIQVRAAAEAARRLLAPQFEAQQSLAERLAAAAAHFAASGFGKADVTELGAMGGSVHLVTSHYAIGWREKWGAPTAPVCHFAAGYWVGALTVAAGLAPERVSAVEQRCAAAGDAACLIEVRVD